MLFCVTDSHFIKLLEYRFKRPESVDICDVYDGVVYKQHSSFASYPFNISLSMNYDGAPKFKSSNMQIWPIQLSINELPPHLRYEDMLVLYICTLVCFWRFKKDYILLAGLWCSNQKPPAFSFLEPTLSCLNSLENKGIYAHLNFLFISLFLNIGFKVNIPGIGKKSVKATLLCVTLDLPAKAAMLNCNQFNGAHGCSTCKHPGVSVSD